MVCSNSVTRTGIKRRGAVLLFSLLLYGCSFSISTMTPVPVAETPDLATPASPTDAPTVAPDYVAQIRNAPYQLGLPDSPRVVQLVDGKFEATGPTPADITSITVMDHIAHGDLNGDGVDEIAVAVAENYGGTGVFVFIAVYAEVSGQYVFQTSTLVDDRPALNSLSIENGEVALDAITHDSEDPFCCPTLHNARHYRLINNQLQMSDYVTFTPDGKPRTITIESPANGSDAYSSVQVKGSVAISPFENTLAYRIYDVGGVELSAGSLMVTTTDLGAPGAFDTMINIGGLLSGSVIRIEIQDISAKDGSLLAMDSVELVVK